MVMETLFTQALGLVEPWRVVNVNFQPAAGRIVFKVENKKTGSGSLLAEGIGESRTGSGLLWQTKKWSECAFS